MDEAAVEALVKDGELLALLLVRNKSQHRRTDYFRALTGCVSALRRLHPAALTELAQRVALAESGSAHTNGGDSWNARDEKKSELKKKVWRARLGDPPLARQNTGRDAPKPSFLTPEVFF